MRGHDELLARAEEGVRICKRLGAQAAEVYVTSHEASSINAVGRYAVPTEATDEGVGIRLTVDGRLGQSGASGASPAAIERVARYALDAARRAPDSTGFRGFRPPAGALPPPTPIHAGLADPDAKRIAADLELAADTLTDAAGVTYVGASIVSARGRWAVANSEGVLAWDQHASERLQLEARVSRGGVDRSSLTVRLAREPISQALDVRDYAREVAARAASALDARPLAAPVDEVILGPGPASQIFGLFTPAFSGKRIRAKQSPLRDKLGEAVASPLLTIADEPHGPGGIAHQRVDHEGTPTARMILLEEGVARNWLYDHPTAREDGRESTGHGLRSGGATGGVGIRPLNLDVHGGNMTTDELIASATRAVYVNEGMMGGFVANETTGDFSLVAPFAFLVENGRISHALPPTTVAGNAHRALRDVRALGRERRMTHGGTFPAIRVGGVSCAT